MTKKKKKKKITLLDIYNSIRKVWLINPKTRVKPNKKKYNRAKAKQKFRKELRREE
jgi:hypothetical protein